MSSPSDRSGSETTSADSFDSELDLLQRYEQMVQTQIETLNGIDDKAAYVARLVALLTGLILSAVSVIAGTKQFTVTLDTGAALFSVGIATVAFFVSLVYAIITYLSSKFEYGPSAGLGEYMADYRIQDQEYKNIMLRGYSDAINNNRRVVINNAQRFEQCLASLLVGILFLFGGGVLILLPGSLLIDVLLLLVIGLVAWRLGEYILQEEYLTLDRRNVGDE